MQAPDVIIIFLILKQNIPVPTWIRNFYQLTWVESSGELFLSLVFHPSENFFTFSSSSPEPENQFQANLAQSILGWELSFSNERFHPFPMGVRCINEIAKFIHKISKSSSPKPLGQFYQIWHKSFLGEGNSSFFN